MSGNSNGGSLNEREKNEDDTSSFMRNPGTITGRLHDELVMMDIEQGKYFSLNPVATSIWDLLEAPMSLDELCSSLNEEYDVGVDQCRREVIDHIREMVRLGLVIKK
jgi:hypothetical protein